MKETENRTNVPLKLLLLNELLNNKVIDQAIYDKAVQKIVFNEDSQKAA